MMFKYEKQLERLVALAAALITVYLCAWIFRMDPAEIVGWVALGIAAGATTRG